MRRFISVLVLMLVALLAWVVLGLSDEADEGQREARDDDALTADYQPADAGSLTDAGTTTKTERTRKHAVIVPPPDVAAARPEPVTYTLRVIDEHDVPVPGVVFQVEVPSLITERQVDGVVVSGSGTDVFSMVTGSAGRIAFDVHPDLGDATATSALTGEITCKEPETVVRLDDLLPLEVRFVDQETGRPVDVGRWGSPLAEDGGIAPFRAFATYRPDAAPVRAGRDVDLKLWFSASDGYVSRHFHAVVRKAFISRYATAVRTTIPIARELRLRVRVLRHDGTPAVGASATATVTGAYVAHTSDTADASGGMTMEGLPFTRGERLLVYARDADGRVSPTERLILSDVERELLVTVRLPEDPPHGEVGVGGGIGGSFSRSRRQRRITRGTARLAIAATHRNGLVASGALVIVAGPANGGGRTDADGRVEFERLPAGTYTVTLREPGIVSTVKTVEIADGEALTVALRETQGRAATVSVVGVDGLPIPNVQIGVDLPWGAPHVQLVDGVQDLDLWTDLAGQTRLVDLPGEPVTVIAKLGSRTVKMPLVGDSIQIRMPNK